MKIKVKAGDISDWTDDAIVVNLFQDVKKPGGATGSVDKAMGGSISKLIKIGDFKGKFKEVTILPASGDIPAKRVMLVGLGEKEKLTIDRVREASGKAALQARESGLMSFSTIVHGAGIGGLDLSEATEAMTEGALLALYRFTRYKTTEEDKKNPEQMTIVTKDKDKVKTMQKAVDTAMVIASSTNLTRDLVNTPSNEKPPRTLAEIARKVARESGLKCTILDEKQITRLGLNAVMAVGKGSEEPPRFVILEYKGAKRGQPIVLVGKGVTFDTGGISLKPMESPIGPMHEMRHDMAGMATVLGTIHAAARLKLPLNLVALAPLVENMPSGKAQKPGDIIRAYGGKTIEVINTDAEGRLILADSLAYSSKFNPQAVLDVATLTGTVVYALGRRVTGVLGNDESLLERVKKAGEETGERVWQLPMFDEYAEQLKSELADVQNTGGRSAGTITAAKFLEKFVGGTPWVHFDIAGTGWVHGGSQSIDKTYMPKGPSGIPVRLLVKMLRDWKRRG